MQQNKSFSSWPAFTQEEADAVSSVLLSNKVNYWTGQEGREFEKEFAAFAQAEYAIAVSNGTVALDLALKTLGVSDGDEVIVTSRTFLASVSSIVLAGATPVFADVDEDSQNITAETIQVVLSPRTKAIICVHLAGWPCDMAPIKALAKKNNLFVIEDCAQAHGAKYNGQSVGSIGDIGCWSFCQDKIMTTGGEGGMVTTNNKELWSRMWSYKDHGKSWAKVYEIERAPGFCWLHDSFGTNGRMTEMQATIGRIQLKRMSQWHQSRSQNALSILAIAAQFPNSLRVPRSTENIEHAWYKCYLFIKPDGLEDGWNRSRIMNEINHLGVPCFSGSCSEVYLEKAFDNTDWRPKERLSIAKELGETSLMFLVHPGLSVLEIEKTGKALHEVMQKASRPQSNRRLLLT